MFNRLKFEITIMKKYIAPSVEVLAINPENVVAMSLQTGTSLPENQLSNERIIDTDWDEE